MTVYNAEPYVGAAMRSILDQTYEDFEFIIVNDGSTDLSGDVIDSFDDRRILRIDQPNGGLSAALNAGIAAARGRYVARQDADDTSAPDRLKRQISQLERHPELAILGSNYHVIDSNGHIAATTDVFTDPADLRVAQVASNQFGHGTVVMRTAVVRALGGYDTRYAIACDADLWCRIARTHCIGNLKDPLYSWRDAGQGLSTSAGGPARTEAEIEEIRAREFDHLLGSGRLWTSLSLRPGTVRGGARTYLRMKNTMYRDLSLLAARSGRLALSFALVLLAAVHAPWIKRTYRQAFWLFASPSRLDEFPYDPI
jgi:hypothetical protein